MRRILLGWVVALLMAMGLTLMISLFICLGLSPELFPRGDGVAPLLGIFVGAFAASRGGSWRTGGAIGLGFVGGWFGFWMYVMGRVNPVLWITEGLTHLTLSHVAWWTAAIAAGIAGGLLRTMSWRTFAVLSGVLFLGALLGADASLPANPDRLARDQKGAHQDDAFGPWSDGTMGYLHTFDFGKGSRLNAGVYDCDSDNATPDDDANTTYLGQDLAALVEKLNFQEATRRQILFVVNGGFFGASGFSVAHHEEPMVEEGRALYPVDLLRPRDQAWFLGVNSPNAVLGGKPRFEMLPSIPWERLGDYQTVLGGVRPLRVEGRSVELKPGAGATTLKCSRTSIGWSADGGTLFVLTVIDPDGELASQLQKRSGAQTGGWDVAQVQKFWEDRHVPFALLFDGGESTQLAFRGAEGGYTYVASGYQYSFTLGYLFQRPLRVTLPILPPGEAHRGVLNYFYVDAPAGASR